MKATPAEVVAGSCFYSILPSCHCSILPPSWLQIIPISWLEDIEILYVLIGSISIYIIFGDRFLWTFPIFLSQPRQRRVPAANGLQEVEPGVEGTQLSNEIQQFQQRPAVNGPVLSFTD